MSELDLLRSVLRASARKLVELDGAVDDVLRAERAKELEAAYRRPAQRYSDEEERAYLREFWGKRPREDPFIDAVPPAYEIRCRQRADGRRLRDGPLWVPPRHAYLGVAR